MRVFIDSADLDEIRRWLAMGVIDGVTTNPSIMLKDGVLDVEARAREIAGLVYPRPFSLEVLTNDLDEMLGQAQGFASWAPNIVVKIPQITPDGTPCYGVMHALEEQDVKVNATAAMSLGQVMLSAKAGATYVSVFIGRVTDEGGDGGAVIGNCATWLERWSYRSQLIIGSIRSVGDVLVAALAGAHVITVPPQFLARMADHKYTRETIREFTEDAGRAIVLMSQARTG